MLVRWVGTELSVCCVDVNGMCAGVGVGEVGGGRVVCVLVGVNGMCAGVEGAVK